MVWVHRTVAGTLVVFLLLVGRQSSAQVLGAFEDLALRVNLDDQVRVDDPSGGRTAGRVVRLTREEIAIQTDAGEKRFTSDTVQGVAARGHDLRRGAMFGTVVFAVLGAVATCSNEGGSGCAFVGLRAAPIGAGVGLAVGALIPRMMSIYRAPASGSSAPPMAPAGGVQDSLLEDLGLRVNLDDQLRVEDRSGRTVTGRLTRFTADGITLRTGAGDEYFTREMVRQVAVRRRPIRTAVLIGAGTAAAAAAIAACTGSDREECADGPILASGAGAAVGLAVGALMHRTTVVHPEADRRTRVAPLMAPRAVGVRVSRSW